MTNAPATPAARHFEIVALDVYDSYSGQALVVYESEWNEEATPAQHADAVAALVTDAPASLIAKLRRRKADSEFVVTARTSTPPATRKENDMPAKNTAAIAKARRTGRVAIADLNADTLSAAASSKPARKTRTANVQGRVGTGTTSIRTRAIAAKKTTPVVTSHAADGLGVADLAVMCNTTPRAMRSFLRSTDQGIGQGSRYSFTAAQVKKIVATYRKAH